VEVGCVGAGLEIGVPGSSVTLRGRLILSVGVGLGQMGETLKLGVGVAKDVV
jgi:hypothetical protein